MAVSAVEVALGHWLAFMQTSVIVVLAVATSALIGVTLYRWSRGVSLSRLARAFMAEAAPWLAAWMYLMVGFFVFVVWSLFIQTVAWGLESDFLAAARTLLPAFALVFLAYLAFAPAAVRWGARQLARLAAVR